MHTEKQNDLNIFERLESNNRSYCYSFPTIFTKGIGHELIDEKGHHYIDFFAGASALNYGHNNPKLKKSLLEYIESDNIVHSLDMYTLAKHSFLKIFETVILKPRGLNYKIMFPGPTGTNAVEAALKLARKVTERRTIAFFQKGFHGMTLGSLAVTTNPFHREAAGIPLDHTISLPFSDDKDYKGNEIEQLERIFDDLIRKEEKPAAVILETVQAEGGINVAGISWLQQLSHLLIDKGILLIIDDIQVGCGRVGPFFSFERAGLLPDIVCLSKSLSGYGIPLSIVLIRPDLDCWKPGEHSGTFRGQNLAFVTATTALETYWRTDDLEKEVFDKAHVIKQRLEYMIEKYPNLAGEHRGIGLIQGLVCRSSLLSKNISQEAFKRGLIIERVGIKDEVLKILPPLTITFQALHEGLDMLEESIKTVLR